MQGFGIRHGRRNTLATQTGEDKDFIHMGEGNTGELGMTSDNRPQNPKEEFEKVSFAYVAI